MTDTQQTEQPPEVETVHTPETHQGLWDAAKTKMREWVQNAHIATGVRELGAALHSLGASLHNRFDSLEARLERLEGKAGKADTSKTATAPTTPAADTTKA
jgi:hypothetical protein